MCACVCVCVCVCECECLCVFAVSAALWRALWSTLTPPVPLFNPCSTTSSNHCVAAPLNCLYYCIHVSHSCVILYRPKLQKYITKGTSENKANQRGNLVSRKSIFISPHWHFSLSGQRFYNIVKDKMTWLIDCFFFFFFYHVTLWLLSARRIPVFLFLVPAFTEFITVFIMSYFWSLTFGKIGLRLHRLFDRDLIAIWETQDLFLPLYHRWICRSIYGTTQAALMGHKNRGNGGNVPCALWHSLTSHDSRPFCCSTLWKSNELHCDGLQLCS